MCYYTVSFAPQMVPLRCQGIIISVGAAALGLVMTCDCKSIMKTPIRRPFLLPPGLVILLLRTWAYAPSIHTPLSHRPHEVLLAYTTEPASLSSTLEPWQRSPISQLLSLEYSGWPPSVLDQVSSTQLYRVAFSEVQPRRSFGVLLFRRWCVDPWHKATPLAQLA
jgi:hypothetical protein